MDIYDEDHDEMIDDKTGEPVEKVVHDVLYDIKFRLMTDVMSLSHLTTHEYFLFMHDRLDVLEHMLKKSK